MSVVLKDNTHDSGDLVGCDAGIHTTVAASDTIQTNLRKVVYAVATLASDPVAGAQTVTVVIPDQVAGPGTLTIKTWKATASGDTALVAGSTFSKLVSWVAFGR